MPRCFVSRRPQATAPTAGSDAEMPSMHDRRPPPSRNLAEARSRSRRARTAQPQPPLRPMPTAQHLDLTRRPGELAGPTARGRPAVAGGAREDASRRPGRGIFGRDQVLPEADRGRDGAGVVGELPAICRSARPASFTAASRCPRRRSLGRFDGELIARDRLIVRASGRVSGKIRYGSIIVDAGGQIAGEIGALEREERQGAAMPAAGNRLPAPSATSCRRRGFLTADA